MTTTRVTNHFLIVFEVYVAGGRIRLSTGKGGGVQCRTGGKKGK